MSAPGSSNESVLLQSKVRKTGDPRTKTREQAILRRQKRHRDSLRRESQRKTPPANHRTRMDLELCSDVGSLFEVVTKDWRVSDMELWWFVVYGQYSD